MSIKEYLIQTTSPGAYIADDYRALVQTAPDVVDILHTEDPTLPGDQLVGAWEYGGQVIFINKQLYNAIRPQGNEPEHVVTDEDGEPVDVIPAGLATSALIYHHYAGYGQRQQEASGNFYADENPPFRCECRMLENVIYGWFPRWEITMEDGAALSRDPSVRNVRVFSDPDCEFPADYKYTTGAFIYGDSLWHVNEEGNPEKCWWSEANQFTPANAPVYYSIYWGETPNGRFQVNGAGNISVGLFWELDQPPRNGNQGARSIVAATGVRPTSKDTVTQAHRKAIKDAALAAGIPADEWRGCDALNGPNVDISYKEVYLRIMRCIKRGDIQFRNNTRGNE